MFIATDAEEVTDEVKQPAATGFVAPDADYETAVQALVDDKEYDPVSHILEAENDGSWMDPAAYKQATEVAFRRKQKGWSAEDIRKMPGALLQGGWHFLKSFGSGLGSLGVNAYTAATDELPANRERAKTEMAAAAQLAEANAKGFLNKIFSKEAHTSPEQTENYRQFFDTHFNQLVEDERRRRKLVSGQVDEKGLVAGGLKTLADVTGDPDMMMSETFQSPEDLALEGAPVDTEAIETMATPIDPTNLIPLHVPGMNAVAGAVGGRALNVLGHVVSVPAKLAGDALGSKVAKTAVGATTMLNPVAGAAAALKTGAGYVAARGTQKLGEFVSNAGRELYQKNFVGPEAAQAIKGELKGWDSKLAAALDPGANVAAFRRAARKGVQGAVTAPIAFSPLAYAASESPEEFASMLGAASFIGALASPKLTGDRSQVVNQFQRHLIEQGDSFRYGNDVLDAAHERAMQTVDPQTKDQINAYRGFLDGLTGENGEPVQVYLLDGEGYNQALLTEGNPTGADGTARDLNTRGFASADGSRLYINGTRQGGGETAGHEIGHVGDVLARFTAPKLAEQMRGSLKAKLYGQDGQPTPQFKKFIDTYAARLAGPKATPEQIEQVKQETNLEGEFIAETSRRLLAGQPVAEFALPPSLRKTILDGAKDYVQEAWGVNLGPFNGEVVAQINKRTRDLLYNLGRLRHEGMPEREAAATPEDAAPAPEAPPAAAKPGEGFVAPPEASEVARAGIPQSYIDAARDAHMEFPSEPATVRANSKRGTPGKSADKVAEERAAEFEEIAEGYLKALEDAGVEGNPETFYSDALRWHLTQDAPAPVRTAEPPAAAPAPEPTPTAPSNEQPSTITPETEGGGTSVLAPPSEVAAAPESRPVVPDTEAVGAILKQAEADAVASPEYKRSRKNKDEVVRKAKINALLDALPEETAGLKRRTDEFGEEKIDGPLDFENPVHVEIARLAGLSEHGQDVVSLFQENKGQHVFIDYGSAEKPGVEGIEGADPLDFTGEQRGKELAASPAPERIAGTGATTVQKGKSFVPLKTVLSKNGKVGVLGFSLDKMLNNTRFILDAMREQKVPSGYDALTGGELDAQLQADFIAMTSNQANGYKGDGSGSMKQFPDTGGPKQNLDYAPTEIPKDRFDVLNMAMHNEASTNAGRKAKSKAETQEARALADLNKGFLDPVSGEVNSLRKQLRDAGFDTKKVLESPFELIRPELVKGIRSSMGEQKIVRPSGIDVDSAAMTAKLPQGKFTAAGFMPDTGGALESVDASPNMKPDINDVVPAIRINGEEYQGRKGETHQDILDRYLAEHPEDSDALFNFDTKENPNFYKAGDAELSRAQLKEAFGVAHSQQLREKQAGAFMPDSIKSNPENEGELAPMYSHLKRVVGQKIKGRVSPEQLRSTLKNNGVKSEEMDWTLGDLLDSGKKSITPDEINAAIEANQIQLKEVTKGGSSPESIELGKLQEEYNTRKRQLERDTDEGNETDWLGDPSYADAMFMPDEKPVDPIERDENFRRWTEDAPIYRLGDSLDDVEPGQPVVLEAVHGTTHNWTVAKPHLANIENDWGKALYLSTTPEDVASNYAGEGPDLTSRIEKRAETLESDINGMEIEDLVNDYGVTEAEAKILTEGDGYSYGSPQAEERNEILKRLARKELSGEAGAATMKLYVKLKNPLKLGGDEEFWEPEIPETDEETGDFIDPDAEYGGKVVEFIEALREVAHQYDEAEMDNTALDSMIYDGAKPSEAIKAAREAFPYAMDPETQDLASSEIVREALERMGYDGIIDMTVPEKFGPNRTKGKQMEGMREDTAHIIVFDPKSIKSATGNKGTFDPNNPDINFMPDSIKSNRKEKGLRGVRVNPEDEENPFDGITVDPNN